MPLDFPTYDDYVATVNAAIRRNLPSVDPTIQNSWAITFVQSVAALAHSNNLQVRDLIEQLFPQTATGEFLDRWLNYESLTRLPAVGSRGLVTLTGINGAVVPTGTAFDGSNGLVYETQEVGAIADTTLSITSITRSGTTATVTTSDSHGLASGNAPTISGATQTEYNGEKEITVISLTQFTFSVEGSPVTPATGTIELDYAYASVLFQCTSTGTTSNVLSGGTFTIQAPITNVDSTVFAGSEGLTGGADTETDDLARARLTLARSSRAGVFTADQIRLAALSIQGNTRIFVVSPVLPLVSGQPEAGQVFVYFLRDNDVDPIPSATIIAETKAAIIEDGRLPANTVESDVVVAAPTQVLTNFTFSSIVPDTPTMRTAVEDQISAFYRDSVLLSTDIAENSYIGAISNTIDTQTNQRLQSFALSGPTGDISIDFGELGFPGTVSFT